MAKTKKELQENQTVYKKYFTSNFVCITDKKKTEWPEVKFVKYNNKTFYNDNEKEKYPNQI